MLTKFNSLSIIAAFVLTLFYWPAAAQIPAGYYDNADGKSGAQLKSALNDIISGHTTYPYSSSSTDVWDILQAADKDPNNSANVIGIYSGFSMDAAAEYNNGDGWNREHVWAKSRGDFGTSEGPGTDCHHLRVADISTNGARGNKSFGYGDAYYNDTQGFYSGTTLSKINSTDDVWEPRDEVKGDVARMMFYMAVRYEGENGDPDLELTETLLSNTDKSPFHAKLSVLLDWHQQDPVSAAEIQRNNVIYGYQNNRNPFIDNPEYVCKIYSCSNSGGGGSASTNNLFFSEYIEGSSYNKGLEIANFTGASIDLSDYAVQKQTNGSGSWTGELQLSGSLANGDVFVIVNSYASSVMQAEADLISSSSALSFNGNDPIGLFKNGQLIDVIGNFNSSSSFGQNTTLVRMETVSEPNAAYSASEWDRFSSNTFSFLGSHTISGSGGGDTEAPSTPSNIQISNVTETSFDLGWNASNDNIGVDQYIIYVDGNFYANSSSTSATVNGLSASTNYVVSITAKDATGNESNQSANVGVTTAQAAVETTLDLSLTFDNYPEETSWEIVDGSTVIANGGPYGNYSDGSTINISVTVPAGCYDFIIYDSYGDGICCSYGNGSYTLSEGNNIIVSGGSYGGGEITDFCVGNNFRSLANTESIPSQIESAGFNIYPNPAITELELFTGKMEATAYQIISLSGKIEQSGNLNAKSSAIDVTNLKSGLYILKVLDSENVVVRKIMVK